MPRIPIRARFVKGKTQEEVSIVSGSEDMKPERASAVRLVPLIMLSLALFGCDHAAKFAAKFTLEGTDALPIAPAMLRGAVELKYVENDDIAFQVLHRIGAPRTPTLLVALSATAIVVILVGAIVALRRRSTRAIGAANRRADRMAQAGLALIVGGALGNIVDRIVRGYVVDFIHVKGWPVFNVADIAVVAGVALWALARVHHTPTDADGEHHEVGST